MRRQVRRIYREFTPEERERWLKAVAEEEAAIPENIEMIRRYHLAIKEEGVSGDLRRAIATLDIELQQIAARADVPLGLLGDFMTGDALLDSAAVDRLARVLNCRLVQAEQVTSDCSRGPADGNG